jgi:hypothetical protein
MTIEDYRKLTGQREHKYHAKACVIDGISFPSKREGQRYRELRLMEKGGIISDLKCQVPYDLEVNGIHVTRYIADFTYHHVEQKRNFVEDAKGFKTDVYRLKVRLMKAVFGIDILET